MARALTVKRRARKFAGKVVNWKRRKSILASIDDEEVLLKNLISISLRPKQLRVLAHQSVVSE